MVTGFETATCQKRHLYWRSSCSTFTPNQVLKFHIKIASLTLHFHTSYMHVMYKWAQTNVNMCKFYMCIIYKLQVQNGCKQTTPKETEVLLCRVWVKRWWQWRLISWCWWQWPACCHLPFWQLIGEWNSWLRFQWFCFNCMEFSYISGRGEPVQPSWIVLRSGCGSWPHGNQGDQITGIMC